MAMFRRHYGASPLHLLAFIVSVAITGVAVKGWLDEPAISIRYILIWFVGAIIVHDLIVLPLYSALDRMDSRSRAVRPATGRARSRRAASGRAGAPRARPAGSTFASR